MLMARLTANLFLTEHLAARAWLKARIKGWRLSGSSQIADLSGSYRVDVPFLTSHMRHLNASALFLNVHTLQSQQPSSEGFDCLFGLKVKTKSETAHWSKDHAEQEWKDTNLQLKFNHYCPYVSSQIVVIKQQPPWTVQYKSSIHWPMITEITLYFRYRRHVYLVGLFLSPIYKSIKSMRLKMLAVTDENKHLFAAQLSCRETPVDDAWSRDVVPSNHR